jgi:hypothetical protein
MWLSAAPWRGWEHLVGVEPPPLFGQRLVRADGERGCPAVVVAVEKVAAHASGSAVSPQIRGGGRYWD